MHENADGSRHGLEQRLDADAAQGERLDAEGACWRERSRAAQDTSLHGAGDVLERLAVRLHLHAICLRRI